MLALPPKSTNKMANKISAPFIQYTTSVKLPFQNVCGMLLDVHIAFIMNAESISSQSLFSGSVSLLLIAKADLY